MADQDKTSSNPDPVKPASQDQVVNTPSAKPPANSAAKPVKPASPPATLKGLSNRLKIKSKMVHKIAIMDLIHRHAELDTPQVVAALAAYLEREDQPALQLRVIEFFESHPAEAQAALPVLEKIVADNATDAQVKTTAEYAINQLKR